MDTRRAKSDGTFNIICRINHFKSHTVNSEFLNKDFGMIKRVEVDKTHPNSKLLKLSVKHYFKIEQALLMLDDDLHD
jgi:hypothetical protein